MLGVDQFVDVQQIYRALTDVAVGILRTTKAVAAAAAAAVADVR